ncbi:MAG: DUF3379 family protein [Proteobacteria bacterium]|nr:DUF3379 family protein [Pseudomonadota bacterium]
MNFSDFKQWLGAEPYAREPEVLKARNSDPAFEEAAREAEAFEHKLESAMRIEAPEGLLADILALTETEVSTKPTVKARGPWVMALAATVFMAVGAASVLLWHQQHFSSVEDYVHQHMSHDGGRVLASAGDITGVTMAQVNQVLDPFSATVDADLLARIQFIKTCPTPDGDGAHFVISTPDGPVTVIFMPETATKGVAQFDVDGQRAHVIPLKKGSIAIIGSNDQQVEAVTPLLEAGIQPQRADT